MPRATNLWGRIQKTDTCWNWLGSTSSGYGQIQYKKKVYKVHRFVYEQLVGEIPKGLHLDHLCKNQLCVNPIHLEPVTPRENTLRSTNFIAVNARKTHCIHGHPLSGENLYNSTDGSRQCRTCKRRHKMDYRTRLKARVPQG